MQKTVEVQKPAGSAGSGKFESLERPDVSSQEQAAPPDKEAEMLASIMQRFGGGKRDPRSNSMPGFGGGSCVC